MIVTFVLYIYNSYKIFKLNFKRAFIILFDLIHGFPLMIINFIYLISNISNYADSTTEQIVSSDFDIFFTFFFTFESLLKVIGFGFIQDDGSYLRESWNQLDFFIVCASLVDFSFSSIDIPVIRVLRILRTLRPLRFISHNSEMKLIVTALLESVGHIINVVLVIIMVWLMFGILAVNLFAGKLFYCSVDTYSIP